MTTNTTPSGKLEAAFDPKLSLPALLERYRQEQPEKVALIQGQTSRTWSASVARIYQMANGLIALGIEPGDRVAILSRNSMAYSEFLMWAIWIRMAGCSCQTVART